MTEKRFIIAICGDGKLGIRDLTTLNEYTSERQVADYMNRITDENEQLKQSNEYLQGQLEDYSSVEVDNIELREENWQLKQLLLQFYTEDEINAEMI